LLKTIDTAWIKQVDNLQALQAVTMNRATNGRNPLYEYQKETRRTFNKMKQAMNVGIARNLLESDLVFNEDGTVQIQFP
jgi:preprotein translocase subunit SecA